ncbi:MAG: S1/P1 nuclease [Stellaceae bacterium]
MLLLATASSHAAAWGDEGHRIAAEIAEQYLEPETARQVRDLLAIENATTLAEVSTWADEIRGQRRETARWHYVNIPIHPPARTPAGYDAARDCPQGECVVAKIDGLAAVLRDKTAPARERLEALKFVINLVADIHQPLDCADDGDRGGNDIRVTFLGQQTNLHALWDSGMLAVAGIGDERAYALRLVKSIPPARLVQWRGGTTADWGNESYGIARLIYGGSHEARALQLFYEEDFLPVVNVQLEKAGVRLAAMLNAALK